MRYRVPTLTGLTAVSIITAAVLAPPPASAYPVNLSDNDRVTVPVTGGAGDLSLYSSSKLFTSNGSLTTDTNTRAFTAEILWQSVRYHRTVMTLRVEGTSDPRWLAQVPSSAFEVIDGNSLTLYSRSNGTIGADFPVKATARYQPGSTYRQNTTHTVDLGLTGIYTLSTTIEAPL